jgi:hypothetical protein
LSVGTTKETLGLPSTDFREDEVLGGASKIAFAQFNGLLSAADSRMGLECA